MMFIDKKGLEVTLFRSSKFFELAEKIIEYHKVKNPERRKEIIKDIAKKYPEAVIGYILFTKRVHLSKQNKIEILKKYLKLKYFPNMNIQIICTEEESHMYSNLERIINTIFLGNQYKKDQYEKQKIVKISCIPKIFELYDIYSKILDTVSNYIREKIEKEYKRGKITPYNSLFWDFRKIREKIYKYKRKREICKKIEMVLEEVASYFYQLK